MKKKILFISLILVVGLSLVFADGDESSDFGSFFDDSATDETVATNSGSALTINGKVGLDTMAFVSLDDYPVDVNPSVVMNLNYSTDDTDMSASVKLDNETLTNDPESIINEFSCKYYKDDFVFEAGKTKLVWGRGDKLHVLDLLCANDYSNFIIPDYIERRIAEKMIDVTWYLPENLTLQAVWTPTMTPDTVPVEGVWEPEAAETLVNAGTAYVTNLASTQYKEAYDSTFASTKALMMSLGQNEVDASMSAVPYANLAGTSAALDIYNQYGSSEDLLPDTDTLEYSQYGLRLTGTVRQFDLGAEYYYGHYKTPSVSIETGLGIDLQPTVTGLDIHYDKLQVLGFDAEGIVGPVNLRGEVAYYLTEDTDGTDAGIHNNSIQYVGGADIGLPVNNMDLNVQCIGSYVLKNDQISSTYDMDYSSEDKYSNNKIVAMLSDSYNHEKIKPSVTAVWGIERKDLMVIPKVECELTEGLKATVSGAYFADLEGSNSEFENYEDNNYVKTTINYSF